MISRSIVSPIDPRGKSSGAGLIDPRQHDKRADSRATRVSCGNQVLLATQVAPASVRYLAAIRRLADRRLFGDRS